MTEHVRSITVPAEFGVLGEVRSFVEHAASQAGFNANARAELVLAVDEATTNVIEHTAKGATDAIEIACWVDAGSFLCEIVYRSPRGFHAVSPSADEIRDRILTMKRGGLGIYLIHTLVDTIDYSRRGEQNVIKLARRIL